MGQAADTSQDTYFRNMGIFTAAHLPIYLVTCLMVGTSLWAPLFLQAVLVGLSWLGYSMKDNPARADLSAIALVGTPSVLVYILMGHPWQIDAHMYFFATLAMVTGYKSMRAVLVAATAIALHHLILNFALPLAVFPEGADFARLMFHAVIVVAETAVILLVVHDLNKAEATSHAEAETAKQALAEAEAAKERQTQLEAQAAEEKRKAMHQLASDFETGVGQIINNVGGAATDLREMASELSSIAEQTQSQSCSVATASEEAASNVQTVAAASEQLTASIQQISSTMGQAARASEECAASADRSQEQLESLQGAVEAIDSVIQSINEIAGQTNMLALNATIEAARAGEHGKGFAVVANEVKSLASQTHKMTAEISDRVTEIKQSTNTTIEGMQDILQRIGYVEQQNNQVSCSLDEQNTATIEISSNVQQAAQGTDAVSRRIGDIQSAAENSNSATGRVRAASDGLVSQSEQLQQAVRNFIKDLQAA